MISINTRHEIEKLIRKSKIEGKLKTWEEYLLKLAAECVKVVNFMNY